MKTRNKILARVLRRQSTHAERILWRHLRNRRLEGVKFRRQPCFGPYILDFYCAEKKINIEIDGGQHDFPEQREKDEARETFLKKEGVRSVRFWNSEVREAIEGVLGKIREKLLEDRAPHPGPLPR